MTGKIIFTTLIFKLSAHALIAQNIGINTTNPLTKLHVTKGISGVMPYSQFSPLAIENNDHTYFNLLSPAASETAILFGSGTSTNGVLMYNNSSTPNGFQFRTNQNTTRMVLDNTGNLGLGTSSPQHNLHIYTGASGATAPFGSDMLVLESSGRINMAFLTPDASESTIWFSKPSKPVGGGIFYNNAVAPDGFIFRANDAPRFTIANTGNIGIATNNPSFKLDVRNGSINTDSFYRIGTIAVIAVPGEGNVFVGKNAGNIFYAGFNNSFNGDSVGLNNIGSNNSFFGKNAGHINSTGYENSFFGTEAGNANSTGYINSFFGNVAGTTNNIGYANSFFGYASGRNNTTGAGNSFFGTQAGWINSTGTFNTIVGTDAGAFLYDASNSTAIGYNAIVDAHNKVRLGNTSVISIGGQVGWTTFSDGRFKQQIQEDVQGLSFIKKLRAVSYQIDFTALNNYYSAGMPAMDSRLSLQKNINSQSPEINRQTGFIAQEVEQTAKELGFSFSGVDKPTNEKALYGLRYGDFVVPLVKAVQEQQIMIEQQNTRIEQQNKKIEMLLSELTLIKEKLK
jgi:endosialidase-like protein